MRKVSLVFSIAMTACALMSAGCGSPDNSPPPEVSKPVTDAQFEESIKGAPPAAQEQARKERAKGEYLSGQGHSSK